MENAYCDMMENTHWDMMENIHYDKIDNVRCDIVGNCYYNMTENTQPDNEKRPLQRKGKHPLRTNRLCGKPRIKAQSALPHSSRPRPARRNNLCGRERRGTWEQVYLLRVFMSCLYPSINRVREGERERIGRRRKRWRGEGRRNWNAGVAQPKRRTD